MSLTKRGHRLMMERLVLLSGTLPWHRPIRPQVEPYLSLAAPSFNGRTAASGAAYRGSTPWGAAK